MPTHTPKEQSNIQEVIDKTMAEFEADLLDGNNLEDCGKAMLLAEYVWEWIESKLQEVYQQGRKDGKRDGLKMAIQLVDQEQTSPSVDMFKRCSCRNEIKSSLTKLV